jgi:membrane protein DedA with SNARE-associated domain
VSGLGELLDLIGRYGYLAVFFGVMLESSGVPVPGETVLLLSGALVHRGVLDFGDAVVFGILGAVVGDQLGYWAGRRGGRAFVLRWGRFVLVTPERLARAEAFFDRHGGRAVFLARFVSGLRVFGALVAGTSRMPWGRFALYNALGGAVWATAAVSIGYFLWASISLVERWAGRVSLSLIAVLTLVLLLRWIYRKASRGDCTRDSSGPGIGSS